MTDPNSKTPPQYLRRIVIRDSLADVPEHTPVHVSSTVLFDDVERPGLVWLTDGWDADGSSVNGSTVSFTVDAARATVGRVVDGRIEHFRLDDIPVLVPKDADWELLQSDGEPDRYRVHVFVREFAFLAANGQVPA